MCHQYHIMIELDTQAFKTEFSNLNPNLLTFLSWFQSCNHWKTHFLTQPPIYVTFLLHRTIFVLDPTLPLKYIASSKVFETQSSSITHSEEKYVEAQRFLFQENKVIPQEIWLIHSSWNQLQFIEKYQDIQRAKDEYYELLQDSRDSWPPQ